MNIDIIAGARPNFIKIASLVNAILIAQKSGKSIFFRLIHTGQHYDLNMSEQFFRQLEIPSPDVNLGAGGGTPSEQTARIMIGYENCLTNLKPDLCLVVGDVTSTMACAIVAKKMCIKVAHVEAGIRSGDLSMPEEINRIVTDSISDYFFTTTVTANENLLKSGVSSGKIFLVGNTMIDTLLKFRSSFRQPSIWERLKLMEKRYFVMTLHRPVNVDDQVVLKRLLDDIVLTSDNIPLIFPVHPRIAKVINTLGISYDNLFLIEPLGYFEFLYLVERSLAVITDSGGITEETTVLGIPCITLRYNTERPETITIGTNELVGTDSLLLKGALNRVLKGSWKKGGIPDFWDGNSAFRIIAELFKLHMQ